MSALAQKSRAKSGWQGTFPPKMDTEVSSITFIKKLMAVALSNITYLRAIFPERAFGNRELGDLKIKILNEESGHDGVDQIVGWIKGCFEALEKHYLKKCTLAIYTDEDNPNLAMEAYTFSFAYTDNKTSMSCNDRELSPNSKFPYSTVQKSTLALLRTCILLTHSLDPIPEHAFLTMKLHYYDDVTPPDYEPPGFGPSEKFDFDYPKDSVNIKVGHVSTNYHKLSLKARSKFVGVEDEDEPPVEVVKAAIAAVTVPESEPENEMLVENTFESGEAEPPHSQLSDGNLIDSTAKYENRVISQTPEPKTPQSTPEPKMTPLLTPRLINNFAVVPDKENSPSVNKLTEQTEMLTVSEKKRTSRHRIKVILSSSESSRNSTPVMKTRTPESAKTKKRFAGQGTSSSQRDSSNKRQKSSASGSLIV